MHRLTKLVGKSGMDEPVPFDTRTPGKSVCDDADAEVGFAPRTGSSMAGMGLAFVRNFELNWRQRGSKPPDDDFTHPALRHGVSSDHHFELANSFEWTGTYLW
jgi:hypothetical protein